MLIGVLIGFAAYALSFVIPWILPNDPRAQWISMGLIVASMVFIIGWFFATRRGFRITKAPTRMDRRLKERQADEREKLRKARMRR